MMTLLAEHAVVCIEAIKSQSERRILIDELTNKCVAPYKILEVSHREVEGMCANMFNLVDRVSNQNTLIMSERASRTYEPEKLNQLRKSYKVLIANIDMIEFVGGGSARCMLAEIF